MKDRTKNILMVVVCVSAMLVSGYFLRRTYLNGYIFNRRFHVVLAEDVIEFGKYQDYTISVILKNGVYNKKQNLTSDITEKKGYSGEFVLQLRNTEGDIVDEFSLNQDWGDKTICFPQKFVLCVGDYNLDRRPDFTVGVYHSSGMNLFRLYTINYQKIINIGEFMDVSRENSIYLEQDKLHSYFFTNTWNVQTNEKEELVYEWSAEKRKFIVNKKKIGTEILPRSMEIPDIQKAKLSKLTHFSNLNYFRTHETYSETELGYFEKWKNEGELIISSKNRNEAVSCFMYVIESENLYKAFRGEAYKQRDSNLYIGDVFSEMDNKKEIGKFLVSFLSESLDEVLISVAYFDDVLIEPEEKIVEEGVYHFYYNITSEEQKTIEKLGKPVVMPDYSVYSGVWYTILPAYMERFYPREDNYFKLEIDSEGRISGCLRESESPLTKDSYAELSGKIEEDKGIIMYQDDGYGHDGVIEVSFFENGIKVYVTEGGEPNGHGFYTVRYYFNKN